MFYLALVSLLWAFSFGLIKEGLAGLDAAPIAAARLALACLCFLPLLRPRLVSARERWNLAAIGMVQHGMMYLFYLHSYRFLGAHEVAAFTIFTPLFVVWSNDLARRRAHGRFLVTAAMAVAGAAVILAQRAPRPGLLRGFALVQLSNVCFAAGQIAYREFRRGRPELPDHSIFGWLYLGSLLPVVPALAAGGGRGLAEAGPRQWLILGYLGAIASGAGFFLWNKGATRVNPGALAVWNDLKIPLAVIVSIVVFGERAEPGRLALGLAILMAALVINERWAAGRDGRSGAARPRLQSG